MQKKMIVLVWVCVLAIFAAGCGKVMSKDVLAKVNRSTVTVEQFEKKLESLPPYFKTIAEKNKARFLDELINEELFFEEASRLKLQADKEVKSLIEEARKKILIAKLIDKEISKATEVNDEQVQQFYMDNRNQFMSSLQYRASHILVGTQDKAEQILEQLESGADFAEIAKQESIDPSKERGGDLGFFTKGQMIPEFEAACTKLDVGELSDVLKTKFGYHVIKLTDKKESAARQLEEVKDQIKQKLLTQSRQEKIQALIERLRLKAKIRVNKALLQPESE